MSLPAADDLFRPTSDQDDGAATGPDEAGPRASERTGASGALRTPRQPSGRVRHDEKMTVYVTADELLEIESARLALRSRHGVAVDRGRLVREAVAMALAELDEAGEDSPLVKRLRDR